MNGNLRGVSNVVVDTISTDTLLLDLEPFFVVITITPDAALEPYSAVAEPPWRIVIDSISLGLISFPLLPKSKPPFKSVEPICPLLMGTPSTTYRGWLDPPKEVKPRMIIRVEAPGAPDAEVISTPGTLPCNALKALLLAVAVISSALI